MYNKPFCRHLFYLHFCTKKVFQFWKKSNMLISTQFEILLVFLWYLSKKRVLFDYFTYSTFEHPHFVSRQKYLYMCNSGRLLFHPQCIWLVKLSLSKTFFRLKWPCRSLFLQCLINSIHRALALLTTYLCRMWFAIYIAGQKLKNNTLFTVYMYS